MTSPVYGQHAPAQGRAQGGSGHATASYIGLAGAAIALIASFIAWVEVSADGVSETVKGTEGDGMFTLVAAIAAIVLFGLGVGMRKAVLSAAATLPGLVLVVLGIMNVADPERLATAKLEDEGASSEQAKEFLSAVDTSSTFGLYLLVVGALVVTAGGVLAFLKSRSR